MAWRVRKVLTYIESNLSGAILVTALARIAGMSCSRFHRRFRARFGLTPHMYVTLKRVEFAQVLMLTTNDSLSQISLACGMTDQAHFTRIFRRLTGETPARWRRALSEPDDHLAHMPAGFEVLERRCNRNVLHSEGRVDDGFDPQ
jgi:AraC family transcriptional regulator